MRGLGLWCWWSRLRRFEWRAWRVLGMRRCAHSLSLLRTQIREKM